MYTVSEQKLDGGEAGNEIYYAISKLYPLCMEKDATIFCLPSMPEVLSHVLPSVHPVHNRCEYSIVYHQSAQHEKVINTIYM